MSSGYPYTPEEDAAILRVYAEHANDPKNHANGGWLRDLARELGRNRISIANRAKLLKDRAAATPNVAQLTRSVRRDSGVHILAPLETDLEPETQFLDRIRKGTSAAVAHTKAERYALVRIESDRPIAFSISSDWHLSSTGPTDVDGLIAYAEAIRDTPGAYAVAVGDQTDNPIKHKPVATRDIPDDLRLLDIVLGRFGPKLLGFTSGNHDDWTKTMVGVDNLQTMAERHRLHYAPDELVWLVEIVKPGTDEVTARWVVATRHKFRRHSNLNHTHACWRWAEEQMHNWPHDTSGTILLPDVLALGHNHVAAVEHRTYERGTVIACRMGAWQYTSAFTRAGGWALMPATAPTVILPHIRDGQAQPHAYEDYRVALKQLGASETPVKPARVKGPKSSKPSKSSKSKRRPGKAA